MDQRDFDGWLALGDALEPPGHVGLNFTHPAAARGLNFSHPGQQQEIGAQGVAGHVGCEDFSQDDLSRFDEQVDVLARDFGQFKPTDAQGPAWFPVSNDWITFGAQWKGWRAAHVPPWLGLQSAANVEFSQFKSRWNDLLERMKRLGVKTGVKPAVVVVPPSSWWDAIPWGKVALVGAVVLLPFYLPVLSGLVYAIFRVKGSAGAAKLLASGAAKAAV